MKTTWRLNFQGDWAYVAGLLRNYKVDFVQLTESRVFYDDDGGYCTCHFAVENLKRAVEIVNAVSGKVDVWLSCSIEAQGLAGYACLGDSDEWRHNEVNMAKFEPAFTEKIRDVIDHLEELISEREGPQG